MGGSIRAGGTLCAMLLLWLLWAAAGAADEGADEVCELCVAT